MNESHGPTDGQSDDISWRKSSFSVDYACVGVAALGDAVGVKNTNRPAAGTLHLDREQFAGWVAAIKSGRFDDLA